MNELVLALPQLARQKRGLVRKMLDDIYSWVANTTYTQAGEEVVVDAIQSATACYIGWGTGTTDPVKGNTDLATPATEARVVGTESQPSADINRWVATITADGTKTIGEVGLFDAAGGGSPPSGGNLVIRSNNFTAIPVVLNDTIEFTINLEQT